METRAKTETEKGGTKQRKTLLFQNSLPRMDIHTLTHTHPQQQRERAEIVDKNRTVLVVVASSSFAVAAAVGAGIGEVDEEAKADERRMKEAKDRQEGAAAVVVVVVDRGGSVVAVAVIGTKTLKWKVEEAGMAEEALCEGSQNEKQEEEDTVDVVVVERSP